MERKSKNKKNETLIDAKEKEILALQNQVLVVEAQMSVQKAIAEGLANKMKIIWRLRSKGNSSQQICEILEIGP